MQITITAIFCHVDDFLKAISSKNDPQCHLILAEIATIALTASRSVYEVLFPKNSNQNLSSSQKSRSVISL
jgi:hypothetical protein